MLAMAGIASAVGKFVYGDEKVEYHFVEGHVYI